MKKFYVLLNLMSIATLLAGCNQIDSDNETRDDNCVVSLRFGGDIFVTDSPMTKVSSNDLFIVQVFSESVPFASGIFDDPNLIRINLKKVEGSKYRIVIAAIKNGKEWYYYSVSSINNSVQTGPYGTYYKGKGWQQDIPNTFAFSIVSSYPWLPLNVSQYVSFGKYKYYASETSTSFSEMSFTMSGYPGMYECFYNIGRACLGKEPYPKCSDWFYGEITDYSPTGEYETLNMDLKRVGFKLKYELSGVTDGEVTVKVYNNVRAFINNTTSTPTYSSEPQFYAFYEARNAWLYADDYMENMTLAVSWKRGIGVTEDYGTKTIQIKRNCLNNIKISLGSSDQSAGMNLTVESENTIGADEITIPVQ